MMITQSKNALEHDSQGVVQAEANMRIFDGLKIADKIEALTEGYAEQVLPYSGTMQDARAQARKWVCEALVDYIATIADNEVMLLK